jgi:hypothetical protein
MGGRGNANEILIAFQMTKPLPQWQKYYEDFKLPYHFYEPEDDETWLLVSSLRPVRVELIPKGTARPLEEGEFVASRVQRTSCALISPLQSLSG